MHFHAGTAEIQAEVRTLDNSDAIEPGSPRLPVSFYGIRCCSCRATASLSVCFHRSSPSVAAKCSIGAPTPQAAENAAGAGTKLAESPLPERIALLVSEAPDGLPIECPRGPHRPAAGCNPAFYPGHYPLLRDWLMHETSVKQNSSSEAVPGRHSSRISPHARLQQGGTQNRMIPKPPPASSNNCSHSINSSSSQASSRGCRHTK